MLNSIINFFIIPKMQLAKHISQGQIIHYHQGNELLSVSENQYYRWLCFDQVVQSVMLKRLPWRLTLPHQTALMLPLLFIQPNKVVELGLGGGNLARFLRHYFPQLQLYTIESSSAVIDCFDQYFNPQLQGFNLQCSSALDWIYHNKSLNADWIICDIYHVGQTIERSITLTKNILKTCSKKAILSLNLPSPTNEEIDHFLQILRDSYPEKEIYYFHIPNYLNIIVHIIPKSLLGERYHLNPERNPLPAAMLKRWHQFWQHGIQQPKLN